MIFSAKILNPTPKGEFLSDDPDAIWVDCGDYIRYDLTEDAGEWRIYFENGKSTKITYFGSFVYFGISENLALFLRKLDFPTGPVDVVYALLIAEDASFIPVFMDELESFMLPVEKDAHIINLDKDGRNLSDLTFQNPAISY